MNPESKPLGADSGFGLGRLTLLLLVTVVAVAGFWHLVYDASIVIAFIVAAEIVVLVAVAFLSAWRWSK
jgi:heme A synthase